MPEKRKKKRKYDGKAEIEAIAAKCHRYRGKMYLSSKKEKNYDGDTANDTDSS